MIKAVLLPLCTTPPVHFDFSDHHQNDDALTPLDWYFCKEHLYPRVFKTGSCHIAPRPPPALLVPNIQHRAPTPLAQPRSYFVPALLL